MNVNSQLSWIVIYLTLFYTCLHLYLNFVYVVALFSLRLKRPINMRLKPLYSLNCTHTAKLIEYTSGLTHLFGEEIQNSHLSLTNTHFYRWLNFILYVKPLLFTKFIYLSIKWRACCIVEMLLVCKKRLQDSFIFQAIFNKD